MSFLPGWFPGTFEFPITPFDASYIGNADDNTARTVYTFTAQAIGAVDPSPDPTKSRMVVVHIANAAVGTINSVTIGGITATLAASCSGTSMRTSIYYALVPTGTTADIVVTFAAGISRCHINVWRIVGQLSNTHTDSDSPAGAGDASRTITIDAPAGGVVLSGSSSGSGAATITNSTLDNARTSGSEIVSCARYTTVGATEANRVITHNPCRAVCGASFA